MLFRLTALFRFDAGEGATTRHTRVEWQRLTQGFRPPKDASCSSSSPCRLLPRVIVGLVWKNCPNCSKRQSLAYVVMDSLLKLCKCLWIYYSFPTFPSISHSPDIATSASFAISSCSWQCWRPQSQDVSATPNYHKFITWCQNTKAGLRQLFVAFDLPRTIVVNSVESSNL